jgi:hypothetical protein
VKGTPAPVCHDGSTEQPPKRQSLRAGPLGLEYEDGELRYLRLGGREVIRRWYVAVRDRNWATVPGRVASTDIIEASAVAHINAVNAIETRRERDQPREVIGRRGVRRSRRQRARSAHFVAAGVASACLRRPSTSAQSERNASRSGSGSLASSGSSRMPARSASTSQWASCLTTTWRAWGLSPLRILPQVFRSSRGQPRALARSPAGPRRRASGRPCTCPSRPAPRHRRRCSGERSCPSRPGPRRPRTLRRSAVPMPYTAPSRGRCPPGRSDRPRPWPRPRTSRSTGALHPARRDACTSEPTEPGGNAGQAAPTPSSSHESARGTRRASSRSTGTVSTRLAPRVGRP